MPGAIRNAVSAGVMPQALSTQFQQTRTWSVQINEFPDGSSVRSPNVSNDRRRWRLTKLLSAVQLAALRNWYDTCQGPTKAFYFYDPYESTPFGNYDGTGADTNGRFLVHFIGDFKQQMKLGRAEVNVDLEEIA